MPSIVDQQVDEPASRVAYWVPVLVDEVLPKPVEAVLHRSPIGVVDHAGPPWGRVTLKDPGHDLVLLHFQDTMPHGGCRLPRHLCVGGTQTPGWTGSYLLGGLAVGLLLRSI